MTITSGKTILDNNYSVMVLRRSRPSHQRHHGAWKVAYADFVSAMMAVFIALWLLSSKGHIRTAVGSYFRDPDNHARNISTELDGSGSGQVKLDSVETKLNQILKQTPEFADIKDYVKTSITGEGLRIDLVESEFGVFFKNGHPEPTPRADDFLVALARELGKLPNSIAVEGHTDATPFKNVNGSAYSNWELSTDRANAARKLLIANGVRKDQIVLIGGFADQHLFLPEKPNDPSNRRISIVVRYLD